MAVAAVRGSRLNTCLVVLEIENQFFDGGDYLGRFPRGHAGVREIITALNKGMPE